jgi:hypothetical protein
MDVAAEGARLARPPRAYRGTAWDPGLTAPKKMGRPHLTLYTRCEEPSAGTDGKSSHRVATTVSP